MKYIVDTPKTVTQTAVDLEIAVKKHGFGVLGVHDLHKTLNAKGVSFSHECLAFEVCNPHRAKEVLDADMSLNMALPCRISVYSDKGVTKIGMISPRAMLGMLSDSPELAGVAEDVENTLITIINEAQAAAA